MNEELTFLGWIDEDDGAQTLECMDKDGKIVEFRNCKLTAMDGNALKGEQVRMMVMKVNQPA